MEIIEQLQIYILAPKFESSNFLGSINSNLLLY